MINGEWNSILGTSPSSRRCCFFFFSDDLSGDLTSMEKGLTDKLRTNHGDFPYNRYTYINILPKKLNVWNLSELPSPIFSFGGACCK